MPIKSAPSSLPLHLFYLFDDISARLCAAYPHLPHDIRTSESLIDIADYLSRYSRCLPSDVLPRLEYLFAAGFINRESGEVHPTVLKLLGKMGADRVKELSYNSDEGSGGDGSSKEDRNEDSEETDEED